MNKIILSGLVVALTLSLEANAFEKSIHYDTAISTPDRYDSDTVGEFYYDFKFISKKKGIITFYESNTKKQQQIDGSGLVTEFVTDYIAQIRCSDIGYRFKDRVNGSYYDWSHIDAEGHPPLHHAYRTWCK